MESVVTVAVIGIFAFGGLWIMTNPRICVPVFAVMSIVGVSAALVGSFASGGFEKTTVWRTETIELAAFPDDAAAAVYVKPAGDARCEVVEEKEGGVLVERVLPSKACTVSEVDGAFRMEVYRGYEVGVMSLAALAPDLLEGTEPAEVAYRLYVPKGTAGQLTNL